MARFNGKYVIGEAKFLTDFGGHQNAQFNDAINTVEAEGVKAIKIAILDGVLYIKGNNKMYKSINDNLQRLQYYECFGVTRVLISTIGRNL